MFLSRVVCFPFAMITFSVGADVVAVSRALLEDENPSFKVVEELFSGSFSRGQFKHRVY